MTAEAVAAVVAIAAAAIAWWQALVAKTSARSASRSANAAEQTAVDTERAADATIAQLKLDEKNSRIAELRLLYATTQEYLRDVKKNADSVSSALHSYKQVRHEFTIDKMPESAFLAVIGEMLSNHPATPILRGRLDDSSELVSLVKEINEKLVILRASMTGLLIDATLKDKTPEWLDRRVQTVEELLTEMHRLLHKAERTGEEYFTKALRHPATAD